MLALSAAGEAATGILLAASPAMVVRLLLGGDLSPAGVALGRLAGFALLALGIACWPRGSAAGGPASAMLAYSLLAALYLLALGFGGALVGILLWPAVVVHAAFTFLLIRAWRTRHP